MSKINEIEYCGYTGKVVVFYNDSDMMTDYCHLYELTQKHAIRWVKEGKALPKILASLVNNKEEHKSKAMKFFNRLIKQTGVKIEYEF